MAKLSPVARRGITTLLFSTIIIFFPSPRLINESVCLVEGLVNVAPFSQLGGCCPMQRHTRLYNSHDAMTVTTAGELLTASPTSATSIESSSSVGDVAAYDTQSSTVQTTIQPSASLPSTVSADTASRSSQKRDKPAKRMGVWMPPSKNADQKRGKIFSIQQPQDLLDFVIEDERLSVVKVYASWCKTCQVFDVRYRGLAAKYGDNSDASRAGESASNGRVRFAEMQYDNPNNEEMCQLLNATKLPYILMYKGSRGKVKEFHCSPAKFQLLIDSVNELVDYSSSTDIELINDSISLSDTAIDGRSNPVAESSNEFIHDVEETIEGLKQQLAKETAEKLEMFEVMKAQIEHDKEYIQKLESGVETQRSMLDDRASELSDLQTMQKSKEEERQSLSNELTQQREENQELKVNLSAYQIQVHQLNQRISELENSITKLELESSFNRNLAKDREHQLRLSADNLEKQKQYYEKERNSLRQLTLLGMKRVGRGAKSFLVRLRGKEINGRSS